MGTARSIHIGMSFGSSAPDYDGENLASSLARWAEDAGYSPTLLIGAEATNKDVVVAEIEKAAKELVPGDCLLITYTGHGGRAKDENGDELGHATTSNGHENGEKPTDSTWCLNGGDLSDDELAEKLSAIRRGVRVVVIVDSCYSQTMVEASTQDGDVLFIAAAPDNSTVDAGRLSHYLVNELPKHKGETWWTLLMRMRESFKSFDWQGPYFPRSPDPHSAGLPLYLRGR